MCPPFDSSVLTYSSACSSSFWLACLVIHVLFVMDDCGPDSLVLLYSDIAAGMLAVLVLDLEFSYVYCSYHFCIVLF